MLVHVVALPVAAGDQPAAGCFHVETIAHLEQEAVAGDVDRRRQALHQRIDRHHQNAFVSGGQLVQHLNAVADDVLVWAEQVVGQGFPVREQHDRRFTAGQIEAQGVGELLGAAAVGRQDHEQVVFAAGQLGQHGGHAAGIEAGPVLVVLSPAGKEVAVGE